MKLKVMALLVMGLISILYSVDIVGETVPDPMQEPELVDPNISTSVSAPATQVPAPVQNISLGTYTMPIVNMALMSKSELSDLADLITILQAFAGNLPVRVQDAVITKFIAPEFLVLTSDKE